ncbi:Multiple sugar-binding protein precursor [Caloramator mitchellensis]|uniref:Multiple sugar-binding protein n=1 Tax=Caloramator mitchellensis TaxID=908809 RepID=A0A0R3JSN5_CALMK|nr:extracellular solute-binding protein [Caloramator mitchellensis]KRQ86513.1 Multiple sugar-binding protein precursor [Caloramator mitchellensis]
MKKIMSLIITLIFVVSIFNGCTKKNATETSSQGTGEKVKIEFFQYKQEAKETFEKLIQKFEQENPDIDVVQSNPPEASTVLRTRMAKRDVPDIVSVGGDVTYADLAKAGAFEDLTDSQELQKIHPQYVQMLKDISGLDKVYAIPYAVNANAVIYNKKLFNELGLTVPKTWDEFIAVAEKTKKAGKIPFYFTFKDSWTTLPAFNVLAADTQGDSFFAERREGKTTFKERYKEAADKFLKLVEYGHNDNFGKGYVDGNIAFAKGESVMYLQGIWAIPEIKKANPDIELGVFPYPVTNDPSKNKVVSGVDLLFAISKTSKNPEAARKFVNFLLREDIAKEYLSEQNAFSAIQGVVKEDKDLEGLKDSFNNGLIVDFPDHYVPNSMALDRQLQQLVLDKNVDAFLTTLDNEWDKAQTRK